jgi:hypothetical protein
MAKRELGCDEDGFNELSKAYKDDPSIENYVKLRRGNPSAEIEVGVIGGMEQLMYMRRVLRRFRDRSTVGRVGRFHGSNLIPTKIGSAKCAATQ